MSTGHFRVPETLTFKMRLGAQPFLWKWVLFAREWKMISISKAEHLRSFWNSGPGELGNGLLPGRVCSQTVSWCLHHILCLLEVKVLRKKSSRHVAVVAKFLDLSKPWSCKYGRKNEKIDMCGFPMNECTRKQNVSPFFSSILRRCKMPFLSRNIVEIQNVAAMVTWRHTCPLYNHPSYVFELLM